MKLKTLRVVGMALLLSVCVFLTACGKDKEPPAENPVDVTPEPAIIVTAAPPTESAAVSFSPVPEVTATPSPAPAPVTVELQYNGENVSKLSFQTATVFQLRAVTSDDSTGGTWTSSDASIASVDENGVVTCWKPGAPRITYTQGEASASVSLDITEPTVRIYFGGAEKRDITLNGMWGFEIDLVAVVSPEGTPVAWTSDDATVASVSDAGHVTARRMGTTTVHARCGTAVADCIIRITQNPPAYIAPTPEADDPTPRLVITFLGVPNNDFTVSVGADVPLNYMLYNAQGEVTWTIEDPTYATVSQHGNVHGVKSTLDKRPEPYTKVIATCGELRCECIVRVKPAETIG